MRHTAKAFQRDLMGMALAEAEAIKTADPEDPLIHLGTSRRKAEAYAERREQGDHLYLRAWVAAQPGGARLLAERR